MRNVLLGAAAGAAGTTALNAATYLDMSLRGRPASSTPEKTVEELTDKAGTEVPGDEDTRESRLSGLGALTGIVTGVGVGAAYGLVRSLGVRPGVLGGTALTTAAVLVGSNGPMTALGLTDPRSWNAEAWVADVVPHLAYGLVTAATVAAGER